MSKNNSEKKSEANPRIILTESEISEISRLYDIALKLSERSSLSSSSSSSSPSFSSSASNKFQAQKTPFDTMINFDSGANTLKRKKAWHAVQEYLNALGKKYNYDPEKFVINKITRELEPYSPESDG